MAAIGGTFAGWYADKAGHKKTLQRILIIWMILFGAMAWSNTILAFWIINAIGGFFFGAIWSVSRAFFVTLIPENEQGKFFSFYSIFERFAVIIGPLLWSGIVRIFRLGQYPLSIGLGQHGDFSRNRIALSSKAETAAPKRVILLVLF